MLERKPPHGAPCTRCGLCCVATICELGKSVFKREAGPCPALEETDLRHEYACGLVAHPERYAKGVTDAHGSPAASAAAASIVGSGYGCDARFNGEPTNHGFYRTLDALDAKHAVTVAAAKRLWHFKYLTARPQPDK